MVNNFHVNHRHQNASKGVNKKIMGKALKSLNIGTEILARHSNVMWDILLQTDDAAKSLADSILMMKTVRLQTEYMQARKVKVVLYISEITWGFSSPNLWRLRMF